MAMRANRPHYGADTTCQLELFDDALAEPEHTRAELPVDKDRLRRPKTRLEAVPIEPAEPGEPADGGSHAAADRATLAALEAALVDARSAAGRQAGPRRPRLPPRRTRHPAGQPPAGGLSLRHARDDWLRRLEAQQKSESALVAYRVAIDDLLEWSEANGRNVFEEATIVDYLRSYQQRARPAQATYYRRFLLPRKFLRWVSQREGVRDPFLDLEPPPKPRQERNLSGLADRDRLTLLALVTRRLQETILADIIRRAAKRAGIEKHVTAHTLRHTAATWLRQELGDTRLVAEYLGHADLSTVARYAHVGCETPKSLAPAPPTAPRRTMWRSSEGLSAPLRRAGAACSRARRAA